MSNKTRGRKKKAYEPTSKVYEWESPTLRTLADICLFGAVGVILAVLLTYQTQGLAIRIFTGCFVFFGLSELLRAADNNFKGGPKKNTVVYSILGGCMLLAGVLFYVLVAAKQPLA